MNAQLTAHELRTVDSLNHMFALVQLESTFKNDISDPVIRIEILDASGSIKDTFIRTAYGANVEPHRPRVIRVEGATSVDGALIKDVRAYVESATCKPAW